MKTTARKVAMGLVMAALAAMPLGLHAEDAAVAPAAAPVPVARVSIASTEELQKLMKDVGFPLPVDVKGLVERQFPFIGRGGLTTDKPMGVVFNAGDDLSQQQMVVFAFPVKEGVATVDKFVEQGMTASGTDMAGQGDDVSFKRTANYLYMFAGGVEGVKGFTDTLFAEDYKAKGILAHLTLNIAALRKAAPKKYEAFLASVEEPNKVHKNENEKKGYDFMMKVWKERIAALDNVTVSLSQADEALTLKSIFAPVEIKGSKTFAKPAFPEGTVMQLHVAYPNENMRRWVPDALGGLDLSNSNREVKLTAEETAKLKGFVDRLSSLILAPDAQSVGLTVNNGEILGMVVNQYSRDLDFAKEIKALVAESDDIGKLGSDQGKIMEVKTLTGVKGATVTRVALIEKAKTFAYIACVQKGKNVYMTVSQKEVDAVEGLAALPGGGDFKGLLSGSLDLAGVLKLDAVKGSLPDEEETKKLAEAFAGKQVTWNVDSTADGKALSASVTVPFAVLKFGGQAFGRQMGGGGAE